LRIVAATYVVSFIMSCMCVWHPHW